jgi:hypothetical protein
MWEGGEGGLRVPTFDPHTINACWFLFLSFAYLLVAEAASFDKKSYAGAIHNSTTERCKKIVKTFLIEDFFHLPLALRTPVMVLELRISPRVFDKY